MRRAKPDAPQSPEARLGAFVAEILRRAPHRSSDWYKYRRLLLALLRERAQAAAVAFAENCPTYNPDGAGKVRAAVVGRSRRGR